MHEPGDEQHKLCSSITNGQLQELDEGMFGIPDQTADVRGESSAENLARQVCQSTIELDHVFAVKFASSRNDDLPDHRVVSKFQGFVIGGSGNVAKLLASFDDSEREWSNRIGQLFGEWPIEELSGDTDDVVPAK